MVKSLVGMLLMDQGQKRLEFTMYLMRTMENIV